MGVNKPNQSTLSNVCVIVFGVMVACYGEISFVLTGFVFQVGGIVFESVRLVLVQKLLSSSEYKMGPLESLYYFAPVTSKSSRPNLFAGLCGLEWDFLFHC
jgi:hypothetical protein